MSQRYVEVELDRTRRLRFDYDALCDLQARLGNLPVLDILDRLARLDMNAIRWAVFYGLRWEDKAVSQEAVQRLIQTKIDADAGLEGIALPVARALSLGAGLRKAEMNGDSAGKAEAPGTA